MLYENVKRVSERVDHWHKVVVIEKSPRLLHHSAVDSRSSVQTQDIIHDMKVRYSLLIRDVKDLI